MAICIRILSPSSTGSYTVIGHSCLLFAPFFFSVDFAALVGFSSERHFLPCAIQVQKKVRWKNMLGVERSEACHECFFFWEPAL